MASENKISMSFRGKQATLTGSYPLILWNKDQLIRKVIDIKLSKLGSWIKFDDLKLIPIHILAKHCLYRTEWHHVNHRPTWFYRINEQGIIEMSQSDVNEMKRLAECNNQNSRKPALARIRISDWKESTTGHEFCCYNTITGIVYKGDVYSEDGNKTPLSPESHEIVKIYKKKTKQQKHTFDHIRRQMRRYEIYC